MQAVLFGGRALNIVFGRHFGFAKRWGLGGLGGVKGVGGGGGRERSKKKHLPVWPV